MIGEYIQAWLVREGDQILMPDNTVWCTVECIQGESDTGRLFMGFIEPGFSRPTPVQYMIVRRKTSLCVYCGKPDEGERAIHLSAEAAMEGDGPEVPLCLQCGAHETPTCEEIWAHLRAQGVPSRPVDRVLEPKRPLEPMKLYMNEHLARGQIDYMSRVLMEASGRDDVHVVLYEEHGVHYVKLVDDDGNRVVLEEEP